MAQSFMNNTAPKLVSQAYSRLTTQIPIPPALTWRLSNVTTSSL